MIWPPPSPPSGPEIDHPVGGLDDIQVVFDDDHRVAVIAQAMQYVQQLLDVVKVQPCRRFIENVQRVARIALGEFLGELDALGFAT